MPGLLVLVALVLPALAPGVVAAQTGGPVAAERRVTLDLEQSLRAALGRSPEVRQAEAEVEGIRGKQLQAKGAGYPQVELTTVFGPSPRARGDQVSSPDDQQSPDITGVFVRAGLEIIQPVFTWGLIQNARLAAEHGVRATQAGVDVKATEVALRVKEAYWGLVAARTIREFLLEVREQIDQSVDRINRLMDSGFTTDLDLFRIQASRGELEKGLNLVDKNLGLARQALAAWTGQPPGTLVDVADAALPPSVKDPIPLETLVQEARSRRPEFTQLREGIQAKRNLVEVERKRRYPLFFVGVVGSAAYATNRDRLDNPYVIDPLNQLGVGPVVGFRYNLDFGIAEGKIKEAEAEVQKLLALQDYAVDNIPLQVAQMRGGVLEAQRNVRFFDQAHQSAKKWLVTAAANFDLGLGESRELADAFLWYAKTRAEYLQALYAYVFGQEQLAHAAGLDVEEVRRLTPPGPPPGSGPGRSG